MPVTNDTPLEVGQIIYILSNKNQVILPAIIHEETVVKTLEGKKVSWKVRVGPEPTQEELETGQAKIMDINSVDGEIYLSLEEIKKNLTDNFSKYISTIIRSAVKHEKEWYVPPAPVVETQPVVQVPEQHKVSPEELMSSLPMTSPAPQPTAPPPPQQALPTEEQRIQNLREHIMPTSEEYQQEVVPVQETFPEENMELYQEKVALEDTIEGPDGTPIKFNLKL